MGEGFDLLSDEGDTAGGEEAGLEPGEVEGWGEGEDRHADAGEEGVVAVRLRVGGGMGSVG